MGRTADEHKEIGKMFGFPDCCIDDFNSRDMAPQIDRKLCGTGYIPCQDSNDRSDNRISNLRIATRNENSWNRPIQANNKTGYKGVSLKNDGKYQANIKSRGKQLFLGTFSCPIEAYEAYKKAATELHGEFRNYG